MQRFDWVLILGLRTGVDTEGPRIQGSGGWPALGFVSWRLGSPFGLLRRYPGLTP
jgi:hypothetical protein